MPDYSLMNFEKICARLAGKVGSTYVKEHKSK